MSHIFLNGQAIRANNIFCIGRNYVAHIAELGNETPSEPLVFLKPNSAILNSGGEIRLPSFSGNVHYEAELVLLIGGDAEGLAEGRELDIVAGYAVGLDLTARDLQDELKSKGWPWTKALGCKGAACMSAFVPAARLPDPMYCTFDFYINGELRQHGDTALMIYNLPVILRGLAETYGLRQGDLIFTGTPCGVGRLNPGDQLTLDLAGSVKAEFTVAA